MMQVSTPTSSGTDRTRSPIFAHAPPSVRHRDPRHARPGARRGVRHHLTAIRSMALAAMCAGARSYIAIAEWAHAAPATALEKLRVLRHISRIGMSGPPVAPYPSPESLTRGYRSSTTTDPRATAIRLVSLELRNTLVRVWDQVLAQLASSQKHVPKVVSQH